MLEAHISMYKKLSCRYKYRYRHWQELDDSFIIVPSPEDNEDQEYNGYRDELLAMDSID